MKKKLLLLSAFFICILAKAQDTARFNFGGIKILVIDPKDGTDGNQKIEIDFPEDINSKDSVSIASGVENRDDASDFTPKRKGSKSIAHYAGFEMGMNGYMTPRNNMDFENNLFDLDLARSYSFNLNFIEHKLPLFGGYAGLVTGMGFTWNNYCFANNTSLSHSADGIVTSANPDRDYSKNRLSATYLKVPLMLELNSSLQEKKSFHLSAGAEVGVRIGSKTVQEYKESGQNYHMKVKGPYNLNSFKANLIARMGYRNFSVFANYALTSLFEKDKGPALYPFEVGIRLVDF